MQRLEMSLCCIVWTALVGGCAAQPVRSMDFQERPSSQALGPFASIDEIEEALCPIIMEQPGAQNGQAGTEYCGFIYHAPHGWYSTPLAYVPYQRPGDVRRCRLPDGVSQEETPTALLVTVADYHSHPWPYTEFSEARWVQGRMRGDLRPTPGHPPRVSVEGVTYNYRRVLFSTRCDHYRYFPYSQEIFRHDHATQAWDKIADVLLTVDSQTGEIIRGTAKLLPGKNW